MYRMRVTYRSILSSVALALVLVFPPFLVAQNAIVSGTIRGAVSDEANAFIPSATVRIINTGSGLELVRKTNSRGGYVFSVVPVATYSVLVEKPGFNNLRIDEVRVEVGQTATEDAKLHSRRCMTRSGGRNKPGA
jgi:Carboxypeptidase regulatory-like domain